MCLVAGVGTARAVQDSAYARDHVVVKLRPGASAASIATPDSGGNGAVASVRGVAGPRIRTLNLRDGTSVGVGLRELRRDPRVAWAAPDYYAELHSFIPSDQGTAGAPGGWQQTQWEMLAPAGVNAPDAWDHLISAGHPGGEGVTVAVIDTGIAHTRYTVRSGMVRITFEKAPDFNADQFVKGLGFDAATPPVDFFGHGTWVASIIASATDNTLMLTGLAYGAKLMPLTPSGSVRRGGLVRILASSIAQGIRYAADNGARVVNMSLGFPRSVREKHVPELVEAVNYAYGKGVVIVASSGNDGRQPASIPARLEHVIGVGATTESGCVARYSNGGLGLDLVAPGGGDAARIAGVGNCDPSAHQRKVCQQTYRRGALDIESWQDFERYLRDLIFNRAFTRFKIKCYKGTSGAAPLVSAAAALVVASGLLGPNPSPDAVEERLRRTARDLGDPGYDRYYGHGLVSAAAATDPTIP